MAKTPRAEIIPAKPIQENPVIVFLASMESPASRVSQLSALNIIARKLGATDAYSFNWQELRYEHMAMIQAWLLQNYKVKTVRRYMAGVKGTLKAAWKMQLISAEEYMRAISLKPIRGESMAGRMLTSAEIRALLQTCQTGPFMRGMRDTAMISLMVGCGLRRAEITTLTLEDYIPEEARLKVIGKGRKERYCYPQGGTLEALNQWIKERGNAPGPLFQVIVLGDFLLPRPVSVESVWVMLKKRGATAGLRPFTPHDLRRTFISNLLDQPGVDMSTASKLAGHNDPAVTARYDRRSDRKAAEAAGMIKVPFNPRMEVIK
ncbi:MAG: site-specific integrase [Thermoplasmata archaeon]|nr:site-specific integrase [Thermoplasmata archaeon]